MSRAYRIRVGETVSRDLKGSDEICSDLELLEILPPEQMGALLKERLKARGYTETEDGKMERELADGVRVTVDPAEGEVSIRSEKAAKVDIEVKREGHGYDDVGPNRQALEERMRKDLQGDIERKASEKQKELQDRATEELSRRMDDVRKELGQVVNEVTREALKRKAASMGQIKEMSEDAESGSLTIKVEV